MEKRWHYKTIGKDSQGEDIYERVYDEWDGEIHFKTMPQIGIWNNMIIGQLSDGMWENSNVDWFFWNALEPMIKEPKGWIASRVPTGGMGLWLGELITEDYGLDDNMILIGKAASIGIVDEDEWHVLEYKLKGYELIKDYIEVEKKLMKRFENNLISSFNKTEYTLDQLNEDLDYISDVMGTSIRTIGFVD